MTKSKRNILIMSVSILLVAVIAMAISLGVLLPQQAVYVAKMEDEQPNIQETPSQEMPAQDNFVVTPESEYGIALTAASGDTTFTKTLTATVNGDTTNKNVEWAIKWVEGATHASENVQTYVKMTTAATGTGGTATLQCLKGFGSDSIAVTVTSVVGRFTSQCLLTFNGAPTSVKIDVAGKTVKRDSVWGIDMVELEVGQDHTLNITLDNEIHSVGPKYGTKYNIKLEVFGTFLGDTGAMSLGQWSTYERGRELALEMRNNVPSLYMHELNDGSLDGKLQLDEQFLNASVAGNVLTVKPILPATVDAKIFGGNSRGGPKYFKVTGYKDNKVPYVRITVTESVSGKSTSINIKNTCAVTSLDLSSTAIAF